MTTERTPTQTVPESTIQDQEQIQPSRLSELFVPWLIVLLFVVLLGLFSPLRIVAAGALLSAGAIAFLPFVIIAAILFIIFASVGVVILGALLGAGGGAVVTDDAGIIFHTARSVPRFYRWLLHKDRTWLWGAMLGAVTGAALLGVILALYIIPHEGTTAITLIEVGDRIKHVAPNQGAVPRPDADGHLRWEQLCLSDETNAKSGVIKDGFGRPITARVESYTPPPTFGIASIFSIQISDGYDYPPAEAYEKFILTSKAFGTLTSKDDLIHSDIAVIEESKGLSAILKSLGQSLLDKGKAGFSERVDALRELRTRMNQDSDHEG
ncbi:MAG TPA: hypothetical protein EYO33_24435 [Phycisphaerales bacterium]|nr:hypothetical protein [Phycisphaerales bacterium]